MDLFLVPNIDVKKSSLVIGEIFVFHPKVCAKFCSNSEGISF